MSRVYFVQAGPGGPIKIGEARNVTARVKSIATHCPDRLLLLGHRDGGRPLEQRIHVHLREHRRWLEWFNPTPAVLDFICFALSASNEQIEAALSQKTREDERRRNHAAVAVARSVEAYRWAFRRIRTAVGSLAMADVAGVSVDQIPRYCDGRSAIGVVALARLRAAYGGEFAFADLMVDAHAINVDEVRANRATIENARDALTNLLAKLPLEER